MTPEEWLRANRPECIRWREDETVDVDASLSAVMLDGTSWEE